MMLDPQSYIKSLDGVTFEDLIKIKNKLERTLHKYEKIILKGEENATEQELCEYWYIHPDVTVRYQMELLYLSALAELISNKYNEIVNSVE